MGRRGPTIADTVLGLIRSGGPQTLEQLAPQVVAAGRTTARNPVSSTLGAIQHDQRFLQAHDGYWHSLLELLDGAVLLHRLASVECHAGVLILDDGDSLIERLARVARFDGRVPVGFSTVEFFFDLPWPEDDWGYSRAGAAELVLDPLEDDPDAAWDFLTDRRMQTLLHGPPGWLPSLDARQFIGVAVRDGSLHVCAISEDDIAVQHVEDAARKVGQIAERELASSSRRQVDQSVAVEVLVDALVCEIAPLFHRPLPPLKELLASAGFEVLRGLVGRAGSLARFHDVGETPLRIVTPTIDSDDHYYDHMVMKLTATDAKTRLLALLEKVAAGEIVEITKHGRTIARLVPATAPEGLRGAMTGVVVTNAPDDDLYSTGEDWSAA